MNLKNLLGRWIREGALVGTSLTVLLGAGTASAVDYCPTPTLAICQGDGYLPSTCGQQHSQLCNQLIGDAYQQQWAALTQEHLTLMPVTLGDNIETSRITPNTTLGSTYVENGSGTHTAAVLKNQVLYRKDFKNLSFTDTIQHNALQAWEQNGAIVRSCKEFVHERHYDYNLFNNRMGKHGADYRAYFEDAYDPETGIADKELRGKAGGLLAPIFNGQTKIPKNLYFRATQGPYPAGTTGHQINPALLALVNNTGKAYYALSWNWNRDMSNAVANVHDDRLERLFDKQLKFSELVDQRTAAWEAYNRQAQQLSGTALDTLRQRVTAQLIGLDQAIEDGLEEAQSLGCLSLEGPKKCDWSPHRFKKLVDEEMTRRMEVDFALCQEVTGNDLSDTSYAANAGLLNIPGLSGDYRDSPARLLTYMNTYRSALLAEPRLVVPFTRETRRSDSRTCSGSFGNSNFGAFYECGAGWHLNTTTTGGACTDFDARIYAYFEAGARLFGTSHEILYALAEGTASTGAVGYEVLVRLLGVDVYNPNATYSTSFAVTKSKEYRQEFVNATARFMILSIPIAVSAGVSGTAGIEATVSGQFVSGCRFKLSGELTPYARLDGYASVAIDVVVASAGVRGEVSLISAEMPYIASLYVYVDGSSFPLVTKVDLESELKLKLSTIDGRVVVFARAFGLTAEKELASFDGLSTTTTLMSESRTIPLSGFF